MSDRVVRIAIKCGDQTCASEPGEFCKYMGTTHFGSRWV